MPKKRAKRKPGFKTKVKRGWKETKSSAGKAWSEFKKDFGEDYEIGKKKAAKGYKKIKRKLGFKTKKNPDDIIIKGKKISPGIFYNFEYADKRISAPMGEKITIPYFGRFVEEISKLGKKIIVIEDWDGKTIFLDKSLIDDVSPISEEIFRRPFF